MGLGEGKLYGIKKKMVRLVAKGFTKTYAIDYEEAFALVAKIQSLRLSIAVN